MTNSMDSLKQRQPLSNGIILSVYEMDDATEVCLRIPKNQASGSSFRGISEVVAQKFGQWLLQQPSAS